MKTVFASAIVGSMFLASCNNGGQNKEVVLQSGLDSMSYAVGVQMGSSAKGAFDDINVDALNQGMADMLDADSTKVKMTAEEANAVVRTYMENEMKKEGEKNLKEGEDFLAANASKEGVMVTASGLQYKMINEGEGENPMATSSVTVHYTGKLLDGTVFDSSVERGQPATFPLNQVIPGWTEGLQLMKPGGKAVFYIPSNLGYGERTMGPIPGNSVLEFEVELISIN